MSAPVATAALRTFVMTHEAAASGKYRFEGTGDFCRVRERKKGKCDTTCIVIIIVCVIACLVAALGAGIWYYYASRKKREAEAVEVERLHAESEEAGEVRQCGDEKETSVMSGIAMEDEDTVPPKSAASMPLEDVANPCAPPAAAWAGAETVTGGAAASPLASNPLSPCLVAPTPSAASRPASAHVPISEDAVESVEPEQSAEEQNAGEQFRRRRYRPRSGRGRGLDAAACPSEDASMILEDIA